MIPQKRPQILQRRWRYPQSMLFIWLGEIQTYHRIAEGLNLQWDLSSGSANPISIEIEMQAQTSSNLSIKSSSAPKKRLKNDTLLGGGFLLVPKTCSLSKKSTGFNPSVKLVCKPSWIAPRPNGSNYLNIKLPFRPLSMYSISSS